MDISISDIHAFQRCRRQWDFTSPNRQGLSKWSNATYFFVGTAFHACLDAFYSTGSLTEATAIELIEAERAIERQRYATYNELPMSSHEDEELLGEPSERVLRMAMRYVTHYPSGVPGFEVVGSEITFRVRIPGTRSGWFRGTIDKLLRHKRTKHLWVMEHKTFSRTPSHDVIAWSDQPRCYTWAVERLTGLPCAGYFYDGMSSKEPTVPRRNQNGTLSKAAITTDYATYLQAIKDYGLRVSDYQEKLNELAAEDNPFFKRFPIPVSDDAHAETVSFLQAMHREMAQKNLLIYPHRPWDGCDRCTIKELCNAITFGDDTSYRMEELVKGEPYGTYRRDAIERLEIPNG